MALRRRESGRRRRAAAALASVGAMLAYLTIAVVPAMANAEDDSDCEYSAGVLTVDVGTDDFVYLAVADAALLGGAAAGDFIWSVNHDPFVPCDTVGVGTPPTNANVDWVRVISEANSGAEQFWMFHPDGNGPGDDMTDDPGAGDDIVYSVNMGAGTDTFGVEYANISGPSVIEGAASNCFAMGTALADNVQVANVDEDSPRTGNCAGESEDDTADVRIDNAEKVTVNTGELSDTIDLSNSQDDILPANGGIPFTTGYQIPGVDEDSPAQLGVTVNAGENDDDMTSSFGNDIFNGGPDDDEVSYIDSNDGIVADLDSSDAIVPASVGTATGMGNDILNAIQDLEGSEFDDTLLGSSEENELDGHDGDDILMGLGGDDDIDGWDGEDKITGGSGDDFLRGGDDADTFFEEAADSGADDIGGGFPVNTDPTPGNFGAPEAGDRVDYSLRTTATVVVGDGASLSGYDANGDGDAVDTGDEQDYVDQIEEYFTGSADDDIYGGADSELFHGGPGNDYMDGNGDAGSAGDVVDYSDNPNAITADMGAGTVEGGSTDQIRDMESVLGSTHDDTFIDDTDASPSSPNNDENRYFGQDGNDLFDQSTDPFLTGNNDRMVGGTGTDTADYGARTKDIDVDLETDTTGDGQTSPSVGSEWDDVQEDVENVITGSGNDNVDGSDKDNQITTGLGNDEVDGDEGNDTFLEGAVMNGADDLIGGVGNDVADYSLRTADIRIDLTGAGLNGEVAPDGTVIEGDTFSNVAADLVESVWTGSGDDSVYGNQLANALITAGGDDEVAGLEGNDVLNAGDGVDLVIYQSNTLLAGVTVDLLNGVGGGGLAGSDTLTGFENARGTSFSDNMRGTDGANVLVGLSGNDTLTGRAGDDTLRGGQGRDRLNGGAGTDRCLGGPANDSYKQCEG
jgi:Ca2+-binding RTX toxin-like protein